MCESCEWETWHDEIDEMLMDEKYDFASDTLDGIRSWIEENEHITEAQANAVENIRNSR